MFSAPRATPPGFVTYPRPSHPSSLSDLVDGGLPLFCPPAVGTPSSPFFVLCKFYARFSLPPFLPSGDVPVPLSRARVSLYSCRLCFLQTWCRPLARFPLSQLPIISHLLPRRVLLLLPPTTNQGRQAPRALSPTPPKHNSCRATPVASLRLAGRPSPPTCAASRSLGCRLVALFIFSFSFVFAHLEPTSGVFVLPTHFPFPSSLPFPTSFPVFPFSLPFLLFGVPRHPGFIVFLTDLGAWVCVSPHTFSPLPSFLAWWPLFFLSCVG